MTNKKPHRLVESLGLDDITSSPSEENRKAFIEWFNEGMPRDAVVPMVYHAEPTGPGVPYYWCTKCKEMVEHDHDHP